jgi:hypothetical protein
LVKGQQLQSDTLDGQEYLADYLSSHADNQLTAEERRIADGHVGRCASCNSQLLDELVLKLTIRRNFCMFQPQLMSGLELAPRSFAAAKPRFWGFFGHNLPLAAPSPTGPQLAADFAAHLNAILFGNSMAALVAVRWIPWTARN